MIIPKYRLKSLPGINVPRSVELEIGTVRLANAKGQQGKDSNDNQYRCLFYLFTFHQSIRRKP